MIPLRTDQAMAEAEARFERTMKARKRREWALLALAVIAFVFAKVVGLP